MNGGMVMVHASWRVLCRHRRAPGRRWVASLLVMALLAPLALPALAQADGLGSGIDSYLSSWESMMTVSKPGFYEGQTRGYITGGSFDMRFPNRNATPFAITFPSVSAGCGGVSLMGGAFSFINMEQFTQYLQAIAQNAIGMAFNLALTTLCPQCATVLSKLEQIAREVAGSLKNSCKMTKELFQFAGLTPDNLSGIANENCKLINSTLGSVSDLWGGDTVCKDPGATQQAEQRALQANPEKGADPSNPPPNLTSGNLFWASYLKVQGDEPEYTYPFGEELMSLYGTYVIDALNNTTPEPAPYIATVEISQFLDGWEAGTGPRFWRCDETSLCLKPELGDADAYVGLVSQIRGRLMSYVEDYQARHRAQLSFYLTENIVGVPILKLLSSSGNIPGQTDVVINLTSRYLAILLLRKYVRKVADAVKGEAQRGWQPQILKQFTDTMQERQTEIDQDLEIERDRLYRHLQVIQNLIAMVSANQGSNASMFARHTAFTSKMLRNGPMGH
jgi:conjugative transfer pilus assembly protein TraH